MQKRMTAQFNGVTRTLCANNDETKARGEWSLVTMAWNMKRMFNLCAA